MAHGDMSDMAFFALLAIAIQCMAFPATLYQDLGPLKAQFKTTGADMDAAIKFCGGLVLIIAMMFSGVSWNPVNGKMAGFGGYIAAGYTAYRTFKGHADTFVPCLFYVYAAVLFVGSSKIFLFPSNPLVKKDDKGKDVKSNHGNFSDMVFFALLGLSLGCLFYPEHLFQDIGPIKAQFSAKSADLSAMIELIGCLMLMIGLTLSGVKWNPINGKMAGLGSFIASGITAYSTFTVDKQVFVPRLFYIYAITLFLGGLHIFAFPSNPSLPKPDKKADKKKK
jgi:hypothetical protein